MYSSIWYRHLIIAAKYLSFTVLPRYNLCSQILAGIDVHIKITTKYWRHKILEYEFSRLIWK